MSPFQFFFILHFKTFLTTKIDTVLYRFKFHPRSCGLVFTVFQNPSFLAFDGWGGVGGGAGGKTQQQPGSLLVPFFSTLSTLFLHRPLFDEGGFIGGEGGGLFYFHSCCVLGQWGLEPPPGWGSLGRTVPLIIITLIRYTGCPLWYFFEMASLFPHLIFFVYRCAR